MTTTNRSCPRWHWRALIAACAIIVGGCHELSGADELTVLDCGDIPRELAVYEAGACATTRDGTEVVCWGTAGATDPWNNVTKAADRVFNTEPVTVAEGKCFSSIGDGCAIGRGGGKVTCWESIPEIDVGEVLAPDLVSYWGRADPWGPHEGHEGAAAYCINSANHGYGCSFEEVAEIYRPNSILSSMVIGYSCVEPDSGCGEFGPLLVYGLLSNGDVIVLAVGHHPCTAKLLSSTPIGRGAEAIFGGPGIVCLRKEGDWLWCSSPKDGFGKWVPVPELDGASQVDLDGGCGVYQSGEVRCWGPRFVEYNNGRCFNIYGYPTEAGWPELNDMRVVEGLGPARYVEAGARGNNSAGHACAILMNDDVYCWGDNQLGQLGPGARGLEFSEEPVYVPLD